MRNVTSQTRFLRVLGPAAAAATNLNSAIIDLAGYDNVTVLGSFNSVTAGSNSRMLVQAASVNSANSMQTLAGAEAVLTDNSAGQIAVVEIANPRHRYARVQVRRADENSVLDSVVVMLSKHGREPVTQTAVVGDDGHVLVHAPAAAT